MRNYSRFVPGEEIGNAEPWSFGAVDSAATVLAARTKAREEVVDKVKADAIKQEGYAQGFAQGHAKATLEAQRQMSDFIANQGRVVAQNFAQLFVAAQAQLADAEQVMARGTLELACELARQILRHELSVNPNVLQPVIREALGLLAAETKSAVIRLHPLDVAALQDGLRAEFAVMSLTLLADATVSRGGCLIESAGTVVDGTLEKRWMRAIASLGLISPWEAPVNEQ